MKKLSWGVFGGAILLVLVLGFVFRGQLRDHWEAWNAPKLPTAEKFSPSALASSVVGDQPSPVEGGVATSQHFVMISSPTDTPKTIDPFDARKLMAPEVNLDVPFTSQAPYGDWNMPYQEACEEASSIMVDAFYRGVSGQIPPDQAKKAIDSLVAYENKVLGDYKDTNAQDTAAFIKGYFNYKDVVIKEITSADDIKRAVSNGFPVIIPAAGKQLPNPYFSNGGPLYHMVVVKGYTRDRFITNDPGSKRGADFTYTFDAILHAAHDWNGGDVTHGKPVMLVIIPNAS